MRIAAIDVQWVGAIHVLAPAVDAQMSRARITFLQPAHQRRLIDGVLAHLAVSRPFAARDGHESRERNLQVMVARNGRRASPIRRLHQRTQSREDAAHIAAHGIFREVTRGVLEDEFNLLVERARLQRRLGHGRVRGADDDLVMPRHSEEHASVVRVRNHHSGIAGEKFLVQHEMHALARRDDVAGVRIIHAQHRIGEDAGGIHHHARLDHELPPALAIHGAHAADHPILFQQPSDPRVIQRRAPEVHHGLRQMNRQPRVIELSVVINHAAVQALRLQRGNAPQRFLAREHLRTADAQPARQQVIRLHPHAVERPLPPLVARHDEGLVMHQVRRVLDEQSPLAQRLQHQRHVALLEIPNPAMHQLRAAAGRALGEVMLFQQQRAITARSCLHRRAQTRRAAADDQHVPRLFRRLDLVKRLSAIHAQAWRGE